jgi:hypothetical protein
VPILRVRASSGTLSVMDSKFTICHKPTWESLLPL